MDPLQVQDVYGLNWGQHHCAKRRMRETRSVGNTGEATPVVPSCLWAADLPWICSAGWTLQKLRRDVEIKGSRNQIAGW